MIINEEEYQSLKSDLAWCIGFIENHDAKKSERLWNRWFK